MTEEEAKTKWCPFVRIDNDSGVTFNKWLAPDFPDAPHVCCIGKKCMAWRGIHDVLVNNEWVATGFCGLAGRPTP